MKISSVAIVSRLIVLRYQRVSPATSEVTKVSSVANKRAECDPG